MTDHLRASIVQEALSWERTPWQHAQRLKGVGVDCANFLIGVYAAVGLVPAVKLPYYPRDWYMHRDEPKFLQALREYADPVSEPLPGDVAMFNFGRHAAHGAIVIDGPSIVHAYLKDGMVVRSDASKGELVDRLAGWYRIRGLEG